ncbi:MAG: acyltransferase, partial [Alphaproteobacteria bacterium]|nr:acyltransferase [Alphaproteobacteria bacterium]
MTESFESLASRPMAAGGIDRSARSPTPVLNYVSIQILRGIAALLVVVCHAGVMAGDRFGAVGQHLLLRAGAAGVDIFFPISGFVMVISSINLAGRPDGWWVFLERRIVRVVPLYWLATTLKLVMIVAVPSIALHAAVTTTHVLGSYFFVFVPNPNGGSMPLVPVGWTLNYEMFFYAVFAAALFVRGPLVWSVALLMG